MLNNKSKLLTISLIVLNILFFSTCVFFLLPNNSLKSKFLAQIIDPIYIVYKRLFKIPFCKDCNVILISLDTLSANHLPCYGYKRNTASNLCQFAKENIMFTNTYANATFTLPSHTTMFTGLLPSNHNVNTGNIDRLDPKIPFLPEILQNNGYETDFYFPATDISLPIDKVYYKGIDEIVNTDKNSGLRLWKEGLQKLRENNIDGKKTFLFLHTYYVHAPYFTNNMNLQYTKKNFLIFQPPCMNLI